GVGVLPGVAARGRPAIHDRLGRRLDVRLGGRLGSDQRHRLGVGLPRQRAPVVPLLQRRSEVVLDAGEHGLVAGGADALPCRLCAEAQVLGADPVGLTALGAGAGAGQHGDDPERDGDAGADHASPLRADSSRTAPSTMALMAAAVCDRLTWNPASASPAPKTQSFNSARSLMRTNAAASARPKIVLTTRFILAPPV